MTAVGSWGEHKDILTWLFLQSLHTCVHTYMWHTCVLYVSVIHHVYIIRMDWKYGWRMPFVDEMLSSFRVWVEETLLTFKIRHETFFLIKFIIRLGVYIIQINWGFYVLCIPSGLAVAVQEFLVVHRLNYIITLVAKQIKWSQGVRCLSDCSPPSFILHCSLEFWVVVVNKQGCNMQCILMQVHPQGREEN